MRLGGMGIPDMRVPMGPGLGQPQRPFDQTFRPPMGSFDKLKGKKKIKKSGTYKLKKGETVVGKRKKGNTHAYVAGKKA